jgi:hypothetical protein
MGADMMHTTLTRAPGKIHVSLLNTALATLALFAVGCAVAPSMQDVEVVTDDTHVVYGSVDVFSAQGKPQDWGSGWTGHNYFYVTILPAGSTEAITYRLDDDGMFYWALEPGDYSLLGYHWSKDQTWRTGHFGAEFSVPATGEGTYLGSIELRSIRVGLVPFVKDRFDEMAARYDARFPQRKGTSVSRLIEMPGTLGTVADFRHQCHEDWGIECTDRFSGVTPVSPECKKTGFPMTPSLQPTFRWQASSRDDVSYDLVLHEAASYSIGGALVNSYMRGHRIAYVEDLDEPYWTPEIALRPDTRYFWSVRMREGETVSGWSTQSHFTFALIAWSSGYGNWFQFRTS